MKYQDPGIYSTAYTQWIMVADIHDWGDQKTAKVDTETKQKCIYKQVVYCYANRLIEYTLRVVILTLQ